MWFAAAHTAAANGAGDAGQECASTPRHEGLLLQLEVLMTSCLTTTHLNMSRPVGSGIGASSGLDLNLTTQGHMIEWLTE